MLCEHCGIKEAEVEMMMVVNGRQQMVHLCRDCMEECMQNIDANCAIKMAFSASQLDDLASFAKNLEDTFKKVIMPAIAGKQRKTYKHICPHCGHPLPDSMFESDKNKQEDNDAEKTAHSAAELITMYKKELENAVKIEDYEKAAAIRDKIAELKLSGTEEKE